MTLPNIAQLNEGDGATLAGRPAVEPAYRELPSGRVMPQGRWKRSLEVIADGWLRRVVEARHGQFYSTFWRRNTYGEFPGDVHSEWAGYTGDAIVRLSHLLPDSYIARASRQWLEKVLASQDEDGYLGAFQPEERWKHGFELWSQDRLLQALISEYEHSGERRVLEACVRAARRIARQFQTPEWTHLYARPRTQPAPFQAGHSLNLVHPLFRLYELTGEEPFRALALELIADYDDAAGDHCATRFLTTERLLSHIVTVCEHLSIPAAGYLHSGQNRYLDASVRVFDLLSDYSMQVTGILSGNEFTYGRAPRKYTEHCGVIEWAISCTRLFEVTGDVRFADAAERAMLNAYFGSKSPDGATLCYNHAPNETVAANWTGPYEDNWDQGQFRAHYSTRHDPRCCNANTSRGFPNFVARAAMAVPGGGIAFVYYGPCRVELDLAGAGRTRFTVQTDYPFEDTVRIHVEPERPATFPVRLRIPGWCRLATILVNGEEWAGAPAPGTMAKVEREWHPGDWLELRLDVPITLWRHTTSWSCVPGVAVVRGALTFALPIKEEWVYVGEGDPGGPNLAEEWNVIPAEGAIWNVALDLDLENPERSLKLKKLDVPEGSLPWQHPPIGLEVKGWRLPGWQMDTINGKPQTPALPESPLRPEGPELALTLVPFAFTHIRMTYLPVLGYEECRKNLVNEGKAV